MADLNRSAKTMAIAALFFVGLASLCLAVLIGLTPARTRVASIILFAVVGLVAAFLGDAYEAKYGGPSGWSVAEAAPLFWGSLFWVLVSAAGWSLLHLTFFIMKKEGFRAAGFIGAIVLILVVGTSLAIASKVKQARASGHTHR